MKVKATITADGNGDRWTAEFPRIDTGRCFPVLDGGMTAQPDECFRELAGAERSGYIQGVKSDEKFMNQLVAAWIRYVNSWKDENCISEGADGYERTMKRVERRNRRGIVTNVTAVWHQRKDGVSFAIRIRNDGVAQKRQYERFFAYKMCEAVTLINEDLAERGIPTIEMDGEATAILAEFKAWCAERDREKLVAWTNGRRFLCPHHRGGLCSPIWPKCRHYRDGRCVEVKA